MWLNFVHQTAIASQLGVKAAWLSTRLKEERAKNPDLDRLRALNGELREGDVTVLDSMRARAR